MSERKTDSHPVRYTIYCIIIFFVFTAAYQLASRYLFRDYCITLDNPAAEAYDTLCGYMQIELSQGMTISSARFESGAEPVRIYVEGIDDAEGFAENNLLFEFGDAVYDSRSGVYYYVGSYTNEYADVYSSTEPPYVVCRIFAVEDGYAAELTRNDAKSDVYGVFADSEKTYLSSRKRSVNDIINSFFD